MTDSPGRATPASDRRDLGIFLGAQAIALLGGSVQQVALLWLVYRVSQSPETLGWMGFASGVPAALMAPLARVLADRFPARGLLVATQLGLGLLALNLAGLAVLPTFDPRWRSAWSPARACSTAPMSRCARSCSRASRRGARTSRPPSP